ncbi:unnamed protein product [Haemonchus placei]|uniref:BPTI/Kunitz inhibitor domain-containing protein n=1 Tax=Haemonchus placei TaxID=6290 RepID=A0A0N4W907_HAEPC|nr:unnamed protein product [Haemonchus placei]
MLIPSGSSNSKTAWTVTRLDAVFAKANLMAHNFKANKSLNFMWFLLFLFAPSLQYRGLELRPPCNLTVDVGNERCDKNATIRYHLDAETLNCLPFKYTGCGGNANNFRTSSECRFKCLPMDYLKCPANFPPTPRPDGTVDCDEVIKKCPEGSSCQRGFVVGICCDNKNLEKYHANVKPDCGHKKMVKDKTNEFNMILLGKSCDHHFCPDGAECHRGAYFAYCCQ